MAQRYTEISDKLKKFIEKQKIFFVATATVDGQINLSPKGMNTLCILNKNQLIWLNVTGSGNETAAHIQENSRMTLMFTAFEGDPMILRLYGQAKVIHKNDSDWGRFYSFFEPIPGARQIFYLSIELVQTSCGMSVPFFDYVKEREQLNHWAAKKKDVGIKAYWLEKNQISLDGKPTYIKDKNT